ncbi:AzlC family ABC transporter permease [Mesobacterium sp. TK19101]|uniref:AzlC family ABC transporter permease n=1 Tax=Mesobacterium hydrothermale TaxID=3111907 RepID=A0ABU6HK54_9RHOB|nr:AzlC family ABC transporter permease [Mesobacterium sp. TK19101]MEC3862717.1 AzlC family ABC transporter permease [Mesobacterium sp. TK19101]
MARAETMSSYWRGVRDATPFLIVVIPFAMLFGVLATEAGLNVLEALSFSVVVIAGAAQFTALQLMMDDAPVWVALGSALAVNLRMAMYSASITTHLGKIPMWQRVVAAYFLVDQTYAQSVVEYDRRPDMTLVEKTAYFFGTVTPICIPWYFATLAGAWVGSAIPPSLGLDFALPIAFLAMIGPLLRTGAHMAAALTAVLLSLGFAWLPFNLGLIVGGIGGMIAGARVELILARRGIKV